MFFSKAKVKKKIEKIDFLRRICKAGVPINVINGSLFLFTPTPTSLVKSLLVTGRGPLCG